MRHGKMGGNQTRADGGERTQFDQTRGLGGERQGSARPASAIEPGILARDLTPVMSAGPDFDNSAGCMDSHNPIMLKVALGMKITMVIATVPPRCWLGETAENQQQMTIPRRTSDGSESCPLPQRFR